MGAIGQAQLDQERDLVTSLQHKARTHLEDPEVDEQDDNEADEDDESEDDQDSDQLDADAEDKYSTPNASQESKSRTTDRPPKSSTKPAGVSEDSTALKFSLQAGHSSFVNPASGKRVRRS